jgi:hypothetical protein
MFSHIHWVGLHFNTNLELYSRQSQIPNAWRTCSWFGKLIPISNTLNQRWFLNDSRKGSGFDQTTSLLGLNVWSAIDKIHNSTEQQRTPIRQWDVHSYSTNTRVKETMRQ